MENNKGYYLKNDVIVIDRELTELDIFVKDFIDILKEHLDYLIVSGFVSIATGRTRGTEDIDIISPIIDKDKFLKFFKDLQKKSFWCYQADNAEQELTKCFLI